MDLALFFPVSQLHWETAIGSFLSVWISLVMLETLCKCQTETDSLFWQYTTTGYSCTHLQDIRDWIDCISHSCCSSSRVQDPPPTSNTPQIHRILFSLRSISQWWSWSYKLKEGLDQLRPSSTWTPMHKKILKSVNQAQPFADAKPFQCCWYHSLAV